jgi:hypothetical protein
MGLLGGRQMDSTMMGRLLQLRGSMLKAMGEGMLNHGKASLGRPGCTYRRG